MSRDYPNSTPQGRINTTTKHLMALGLLIVFVTCMNLFVILSSVLVSCPSHSLQFPETTQVSITNNSSLQESNLTIIAIGCNRVDGLLRTLNSVRESNFPLGTTLHICIDACGISEVLSVAKDFEWDLGKKIVTVREKQFGLAKHITNCWENPHREHWALFLEDDVVVDKFAFSAFSEAILIRAKQDLPVNIVSIALHDVRVNQYCWKDRMKYKPCPKVHQLCGTRSDTWSVIGSLLCLNEDSPGSWALYQMPSSWGSFYEGQSWSRFQKYAKMRSKMSIGHSLHLAVPHSFSNEWDASWKRSFLELMFVSGWTSMNRVDSQQKGFAKTFRDHGVHTGKHVAVENEKKCLISMPLKSEHSFTPDLTLNNDSHLMKSFDYCSFETPLARLSRQAIVASDVLLRQLNTFRFASAFHVTRSEVHPDQEHDEIVVAVLPSGYDMTFLEKAEVMVVTSFSSTGSEFVRASNHFHSFGGLVHFLVVAPKSICSRLMRGNIYATCFDEIHFKSKERGENHSPVLKKLLMAAFDYSGPNIKWIGYMNGDILIGSTLIRLLASLQGSRICNGRKTKCVLTGQRTDIDLSTGKKKLHSVYAMDYFLFTIAGLEFMLQSNRLPPFTVGLIRWDSWLMAFVASSSNISAIDLSKVLEVKYYMNFEEDFGSKRNPDRWNLNPADQSFRIGRTDNANYQMNNVTWDLEPLLSTEAIQKEISESQLRWTFDGQLEMATNFLYISDALPIAKYPCLCGLLRSFDRMEDCRHNSELIKPLIELCSTQKDFVKAHNTVFGEMIVFRGEFFSMLSGCGMNDHKAFMMSSQLFSMHASKCCIFAEPSKRPEKIPHRFWDFGETTKQFYCLNDGLYH